MPVRLRPDSGLLAALESERDPLPAMRYAASQADSARRAQHGGPAVNFPELVRTCPTIAELKAGAVSIAEHEARPWFTYWLADSTIFAMAIDAAAEALDVAPAEIREIALTGLLDAYHTARRRRAKRETNAQDAIRGARRLDGQNIGPGPERGRKGQN